MRIIGTKALFGVALLSALWAATPASAIPITDTVDPSPDITITTTTPTSFVHDITDNGFVVGDTITGATVAIHLVDESGGGSEDYTFVIGTSGQTFSDTNVPSGGGGETSIITFTIGSIADLALDGKITIQVTSTDGSFLFADSLLTAQVTKRDVTPPGQVPEPSTLLLLGAAFAAFGWRVRRRS